MLFNNIDAHPILFLYNKKTWKYSNEYKFTEHCFCITTIYKSTFVSEESNASEIAGSSPIIGERHGSASGSTSPVAASKASKAASTDPWPTQTDEDIDRLVALHKVCYTVTSY